jgi:hypothetical protein
MLPSPGIIYEAFTGHITNHTKCCSCFTLGQKNIAFGTWICASCKFIKFLISWWSTHPKKCPNASTHWRYLLAASSVYKQPPNLSTLVSFSLQKADIDQQNNGVHATCNMHIIWSTDNIFVSSNHSPEHSQLLCQGHIPKAPQDLVAWSHIFGSHRVWPISHTSGALNFCFSIKVLFGYAW